MAGGLCGDGDLNRASAASAIAPDDYKLACPDRPTKRTIKIPRCSQTLSTNLLLVQYGSLRGLELRNFGGNSLILPKTADCVAETVGFEPTIESPLYTLSRRAPSTTRPRLRNAFQQRLP